MNGELARCGEPSILASSSVISALSLFGVATGFALNAMMAAKYGVGAEVDAFFVANTVPTLVYGLARASCTTVLVPAFARCAVTRPRDEARRLLSVCLTYACAAGAVATLTGIVAGPYLVRILAPGATPQVYGMAVGLARVLFLCMMMTWVVAVLRAFLYSQCLFAAPSALEGIQKLCIVVAFSAMWRTTGIMAVAYGYLLGTMAQLATGAGIVIARWGAGYCYFSLEVTQQDIATVRELSYSLCSSLLGQGTVAVDRFVASFLPTGSIAVMGYVRTLADVIGQVFLGSVPLALLPSLASSLARDCGDAVANRLALLLRVASCISLPVATYLLMMSRPIVSILFQRGLFGQQAALLAASALAISSLTVLFEGHFRAVQFYLYARLRAGLVLLLFCLYGAGNLLLDLALARLWGVRGIALSSGLAYVAPLALGFLMMSRSLAGSVWRGLAVLNAKILAACLLALLVSAGFCIVSAAVRPPSGAQQVVSAAATSAVYTVTLGISARAARIGEIAALYSSAAHVAQRALSRCWIGSRTHARG